MTKHFTQEPAPPDLTRSLRICRKFCKTKTKKDFIDFLKSYFNIDLFFSFMTGTRSSLAFELDLLIEIEGHFIFKMLQYGHLADSIFHFGYILFCLLFLVLQLQFLHSILKKLHLFILELRVFSIVLCE